MMIEHRPFLALGAIRSDSLGPLYVWNDDEFATHAGSGLHAHRTH
ncbi:hypothetical protein [Paraburkholderia translucens]|nr:hypothetical protein [Paraburkholderia sp. MMS20-SJTN17]